MIITVDYKFRGTSFVIAFRSRADADRFKDFAEAYARECTPRDWSETYVLHPDYCFGQYNHVPRYAVWAVDPEVVSRMVQELYEVRRESPQLMGPRLTVGGRQEHGLTFELEGMPPPKYSKN